MFFYTVVKDYHCLLHLQQMEFKILTNRLLDDFTKSVKGSLSDKMDKQEKAVVPIDYFQLYKLVSSV